MFVTIRGRMVWWHVFCHYRPCKWIFTTEGKRQMELPRLLVVLIMLQLHITNNYYKIDTMQDVLNFGRSGAGAPVKDSSGKVKAVVVGNPEIRFQENEGVQKSIQNAIRYHADPDLKSQYHADLGELS